MQNLISSCYPQVINNTAIAFRTVWRGARCGLLVLTVGALAGLTGCASLGERVEQQPLPPGAPDVAAVLGDLAANDAAVQSFRAGGTVWLESPELNGTRKFESSSILFRRPADLYVVGRNELGMTLARLTSVGSEFLIEFPASKDEPYYKLEGEQVEGLPFSVSPSDIAREMFIPEPWNELKPREVRIRSYAPSSQTALLEIGPRRAPRRLVTVVGSPWVVVRNELIGPEGETIAVTTKERYHQAGGIRFPELIEAVFPAKNTRMKFDMRNIKPNAEIEDDKFDIEKRAREAGIDLKQLRREQKAQEPK